jgi:aminoglycoside/choline kinase family phosphotransferase
MDHCLTVGAGRFIVNTHHLAAAYEDAFPDRRWRKTPIIFRHEPILLDTAGGLKNIEDLLSEEEPLLVYNGDILSDIQLSRLLAAHRENGQAVTLALRSRGPLQNVSLDERGWICDIRGVFGNPGARSCLFTGIYLVERGFLRRLTEGRAESVVFPLLEMIREKPGSVASVVIDEGTWEDIGDLTAYNRVCNSPPPLVYEKEVLNLHEEPSEKSIESPQRKEEETFVRETLGIATEMPLEMSATGKGGSDRAYFRVAAPGRPSVILMRYGEMYAENDLYVPVASFLRAIGVSIPAIHSHDPGRRLILIEDLGDADLYALRENPWEERRVLYEKTLEIVEKMHAFPPDRLPASVHLMPGYDEKLYRWERDYFLENLVRNVCRLDSSSAEAQRLEAELAGLAGRLLKMEPVLIHRDLQSQNVMIKGGNPVLIDFQGLRPGSRFYDLGSLLYDPYVEFPAGAREGLLRCYCDAAGPKPVGDELQGLFFQASAQRLMQALGAYGFLGLKRGKPHFLLHIPRALQNLVEATEHAGILPELNALARRCQRSLGDSLLVRPGKGA